MQRGLTFGLSQGITFAEFFVMDSAGARLVIELIAQLCALSATVSSASLSADPQSGIALTIQLRMRLCALVRLRPAGLLAEQALDLTGAQEHPSCRSARPVAAPVQGWQRRAASTADRRRQVCARRLSGVLVCGVADRRRDARLDGLLRCRVVRRSHRAGVVGHHVRLEPRLPRMCACWFRRLAC